MAGTGAPGYYALYQLSYIRLAPNDWTRTSDLILSMEVTDRYTTPCSFKPFGNKRQRDGFIARSTRNLHHDWHALLSTYVADCNTSFSHFVVRAPWPRRVAALIMRFRLRGAFRVSQYNQCGVWEAAGRQASDFPKLSYTRRPHHSCLPSVLPAQSDSRLKR